jgi:cell division protein ZapA
MSAIRDAGKVKARERIAVLAALNLAYQLADRAPRTSPPAVAPAQAVAVDAAAIDALVRRVDAALEDDGRLL